MHCSICETPLLIAPGIGWYCPDLQCDWHNIYDNAEARFLAAYEQKRRQRRRPGLAGHVERGMAETAGALSGRLRTGGKAMAGCATEYLTYRRLGVRAGASATPL